MYWKGWKQCQWVHAKTAQFEIGWKNFNFGHLAELNIYGVNFMSMFNIYLHVQRWLLPEQYHPRQVFSDSSAYSAHSFHSQSENFDKTRQVYKIMWIFSFLDLKDFQINKHLHYCVLSRRVEKMTLMRNCFVSKRQFLSGESIVSVLFTPR